ncbi:MULTISPECIES: 6,7-dimethyl-8-ribityllumazine synthase [Dethiosulfovibrio]|jgi:6,7-dimethyl-8-ribityllumazine synthase|uniref:6,7-dimethyl-8-ribityllumazine synthase n=2 Tax=Dethiosulfovibrio TaxID=47054 RepID=A0ABS9ELM9_9BACT|nr:MULTISPECIES: 6,7-dimethyl-8-ribityllumazine synthase [Dethiosulfovibrio]MCF4113580.1 6,7-dimethyl-8-ribityllumazine synthase [Dethiosulfovibrio russensis]MCF4142050.1 6,7-dimethyl-8-ribityllumazine synthase [Dethiosulfovibrio marinus]MCF4144205.1 6,7-dimethyl-8-ribityllumazine synthase [Dethiosulfovibrio acidaminovorans]MEA3283404.1 6,7-dimethyl-8-ribityllumazine synthase [Synergistota bacterium]
MKIYQGKLVAEGGRYAVIVSRFNELISSKLLEGTKDALFRHGVKVNDVEVFWVPGAWEIPLVAKELALLGKFDAVIALGAVIRGDTPHFEYVSSEVSKGLANIGLDQRTPISFGVLTCDNLEQALLRAGSKAGNKGAEAAIAALEMVNLLKEIRITREG